VLLAGVAAVPVWQFTAAVFTARFIRYFGEGLLAVYLGDEAGVFIQAHAQEVGLGLAALALAGGVGWILWQRRKKGA
jgi:LPXTG-motif cell wall-anchored protein